ncbi:MAG: hypothetical protein ACYTG0_17380 [Planctomycetota bacterium]|jgi:hypothetical protein
MNDWIDDVPLDDDWHLDLLVDNELDEDQRRRLLAFLDDRPDGWRRLAMAFLESQCCASDLEGFAHQQPVKATGWLPARPSRFIRHVAVAVGLLLAFTLGMVVRGERGSADNASTAGVEEPAPLVDRSPDEASPLVDDDLDPSVAYTPVSFAGASPAADRLVWQMPSALPPEVVSALRQTGHRIDRAHGHFTVDLDGDGQIVVPWEHLTIEREERPVF